MKIILGSSSQWRRMMVKEFLGIEDVDWRAPDIDEKAIRDPDPEKLTLMIALAKAEALIPRISEDALVICSDQVTVYKGEIREKPVDRDECISFLNSYEFAPAETVTAVVVTNTKTGKKCSGVDHAKQYFAPIPDEVKNQLIDKGDIMTCCGGFMVSDPIMDPYLREREGERESIIGLPKALTLRLLKEAEEE